MQKPLYVIIKELEINKSFVKQGNLYLFKTKLELIGYDVQIVQSLREVQRKPRIIQLYLL